MPLEAFKHTKRVLKPHTQHFCPKVAMVQACPTLPGESCKDALLPDGQSASSEPSKETPKAVPWPLRASGMGFRVSVSYSKK